ncbi:hypothetical protein EUGRSUZ_E02544 [Eucalyptus grandis]|uniref:Uncharacterized protein n=2 Tax=Eucalyptus grandis TaxID=71139 RepID=A0ACC3KXE7_EUCGR|nr:hypothetical protein EUGRSUZ_E02544 [Eucalyptus grandis]
MLNTNIWFSTPKPQVTTGKLCFSLDMPALIHPVEHSYAFAQLGIRGRKCDACPDQFLMFVCLQRVADVITSDFMLELDCQIF